jgi:hypothetical protein
MCHGKKLVLVDGHIPMNRGFVMTKAFLFSMGNPILRRPGNRYIGNMGPTYFLLVPCLLAKPMVLNGGMTRAKTTIPCNLTMPHEKCHRHNYDLLYSEDPWIVVSNHTGWGPRSSESVQLPKESG